MEKKQELENQIRDLSGQLKSLTQQSSDTKELEELVHAFLADFPVIAEHQDFHGEASGYADSAHIFFGVLNSILSKYVERREKEDLVKDIISWIDNLYNQSTTSESVRNLLAVEFFEQADGSDVYADYLKSHLSGKIAEDFEGHSIAK